MARLIKPEWCPPDGRIARCIIHWTAGAYRISGIDRAHYHAICGLATKNGGTAGIIAVRGTHSAAANNVTSDGHYAAHTKGLNTGSFGLAVACMAGAVQGKSNGDFPLTPELWEALAQAAAEVLSAYKLPVTERTVLQHGEVERIYQKPQRGKWDCCYLPWQPALKPRQVCDLFRERVKFYYPEKIDVPGKPPAAGGKAIRVSVNGEDLPRAGHLDKGGHSWGPVRAIVDRLTGWEILGTGPGSVQVVNHQGDESSWQMVVQSDGTGYVALASFRDLGASVDWKPGVVEITG
jgi:hypothetical protein